MNKRETTISKHYVARTRVGSVVTIGTSRGMWRVPRGFATIRVLIFAVLRGAEEPALVPLASCWLAVAMAEKLQPERRRLCSMMFQITTPHRAREHYLHVTRAAFEETRLAVGDVEAPHAEEAIVKTECAGVRPAVLNSASPVGEGSCIVPADVLEVDETEVTPRNAYVKL